MDKIENEKAIGAARDWTQWVSATQTRNWFHEDPILDWLDMHGAAAGFTKDTDTPQYIQAADFTEFVKRKGLEFEAGVTRLLDQRLVQAGLKPMVRVCEFPWDSKSEEHRNETIKLMAAATPVILQGVLWDDENCVYGVPDLLVRSDLLNLLCDKTTDYPAASTAALRLGLDQFHYVIVDIKFKSLTFDANWEASNDAAHYKAQLALYNGALGKAQGFEPPKAFFIGRKWKKGSGKTLEEGTSCLDRLVPVSLPLQPQNKKEPIDWHRRAMEAVAWIRRVRAEGANWQVTPTATVNELRPNMGNKQDAPWHTAKREIAEETGEPTLVWYVGLETRNTLLACNSGDWRAPGFRYDLAIGRGGSTGDRIAKMIEVNRGETTSPVIPEQVDWVRDEWASPEPLEFFVDFETTSNLDDDFSKLPHIGGQPLIFMIGCGHWEPSTADAALDPLWSLDPTKRRWAFRVFYTKDISEAEEERIILEWARYMEEVRAAIPTAPNSPKVFHWSPAEVSTYSLGADSAFVRHLRPRGWPEPNWYDFLQSVIKQSGTSNAIYVKGAWGFGLKAIGKALHSLGLIDTLWVEGPADGLAAMGGSWVSYHEAAQKGIPVEETSFPDASGKTHYLYKEIIRYNEIDCRVMAESICYLRRYH
ncbi:MAG: hypothetical protein IT205_07185 [Fimbriimonadaceae bacterium]|nr:hypothetical protein [Fimbriimonadaceae bacterium]